MKRLPYPKGGILVLVRPFVNYFYGNYFARPISAVHVAFSSRNLGGINGPLLARRPARQTGGMDSSQLTEKQLDALFERLAPLTSYLAKLRKRVDTRAFPEDDELAKLVREAHDAAHRLSIHAHYLSCGKADRKR